MEGSEILTHHKEGDGWIARTNNPNAVRIGEVSGIYLGQDRDWIIYASLDDPAVHAIGLDCYGGKSCLAENGGAYAQKTLDGVCPIGQKCSERTRRFLLHVEHADDEKDGKPTTCVVARIDESEGTNFGIEFSA